MFKKCIIYFLVTFFSIGCIYSQATNLKFNQLNINNGLSHSKVVSLIEDSQGFLWFGTEDGLNKYDSYKFKVYRNIPGDSTSLSNNKITSFSITEDSEGFIWVGTQNGLNCYNKQTGVFTRYFENNITNNSIQCIFEDEDKNLWVGTYAGLNFYDRRTKHFIKYRQESQKDSPIDYISKIADDKNGNLVISTKKGLSLFNKKSRRFAMHPAGLQNNLLAKSQLMDVITDKAGNLWISTIYNGLFCYTVKHKVLHYPNSKSNNGFLCNTIYFTHLDTQNNIWIGTDANGLYKFNIINETFENFTNNENDNNTIASNCVYAVCEDKSGLMFFGTTNGISFFNRNVKYRHFKKVQNTINSLPNNNVTAFCKDHKGNILVGTDGEGISVFNPANETFLSSPFNSKLKSLKVIDLAADKNGKIWVGTWAGGLHCIDLKKNTIRNFIPENENPHSIMSPDILALCIDKQDNIWVSTFLKGLDCFDQRNNYFVHFTSETEKFKTISNFIYALYNDSYGNSWVGNLGSGICRLKYNKELPVTHENVQLFRYEKSTTTSSENINVFFEDNEKNLWIGTINGLVSFNYSTDSTIIYMQKDGLPHNSICGILEDQHKNLWISTYNGISKFNKRDKTFKNYDLNDGLQSNQFNLHSCFKDADGTMYFGGNNGFNAFHPDSITENSVVPPVVITDFKIFKEPVSIGEKLNGRVVLKKDISYLKKIELLYNESMITFDFAALNHISPEKNQYAYFLDGFDQTMHYVDKERTATYTNLAPGEYVFKVIASNNDGIWNSKGSSITILILPPWYKTWWAYLLYVCIIGAVIYFVRLAAKAKEKIRKQLEIEQLEFEKAQAINEKTLEIEQLKLRFYTNISHEFRTPLTLILGPLEHFFKNRDSVNWAENERFFTTMYRNAQRLLQLINKILDIRKLESGSMKLYLQKGNMVGFIISIAESFIVRAEKRSIGFNIRSTNSDTHVYFDNDVVDKIVFNLLSNAFKFTSENGNIDIFINLFLKYSLEWQAEKEKLALSYTDNFIKISVTDNGIGIPANQAVKIFERFYQADNVKSHSGGSGIGLSLVKELIDLCAGKIEVHSHEGQGSIFTVWLPAGDDITSLPGVEIVEQEQESIDLNNHFLIENNADTDIEDNAVIDKGLPLVLVVEDNFDMQTYIANLLQPSYRVITASNGSVGLQKAIEMMPDLIISDIMMPEMSGTELCYKLKTDTLTSHIPVILLTARSSEQDIVEGIETGADEYITKPFSNAILEAKVKNIIRIRLLLKNKFCKGDFVSAKEISSNSVDEKFLQKAIEIVEKNISDYKFGNEQFIAEMGMSRANLYRKLDAVTNQSVNEFIRTIRLKYATKLLSDSTLSVSEVAFKAGFSDSGYFTRCFSNQYGIAPSKYASQFKNKN